MNAKIFLGLCLIGLVGFLAFYFQAQSEKPEKIKNLQEEVIMLQLVKEAVIEKYVPNSIKQARKVASYNLMHNAATNGEWLDATRAVEKAETDTKACKPYVYIDSLLQAKEQELKELQN